MPIYKKYLDQIISGTKEDLHGEKRTKEHLESLVSNYPKRMPLNQQHDMQKETLGYLENFRVVSDKTDKSEWSLIADIYVTSDDIDEALKGFSISFFETIGGNTESPLYYIHLPYPLYNDTSLVSDLISSDKELLVGKWVKKAVDPITIGLVATGIALFLSPEWDIQYKKLVRPQMEKLIGHVSNLLDNDITVDLVQHVVGHLDESIKVYLIPDRNNEIESLHEDLILDALKMTEEFLNGDNKSKITGVDMMKFYFESSKRKYVLFHVQYLDGTDVHIA